MGMKDVVTSGFQNVFKIYEIATCIEKYCRHKSIKMYNRYEFFKICNIPAPPRTIGLVIHYVRDMTI